MAATYGMKKQSLYSGEGAVVTEKYDPYLLPII